MTKPIAVPPAHDALDRFAAHFDPVFRRLSQRQAFRQYLRGLLLPPSVSKNLHGIARNVPGANVEALQHFLVHAPWSVEDLNTVRVALLDHVPALHGASDHSLIITATSTIKQGDHSPYLARQSLQDQGRRGKAVVAVSSHWVSPFASYPLDVLPLVPGLDPTAESEYAVSAALVSVVQDLVDQATDARGGIRTVIVGNLGAATPAVTTWLSKEGFLYVTWDALAPVDWSPELPRDRRTASAPLRAGLRIPEGAWQVVDIEGGAGQPWYAAELDESYGAPPLRHSFVVVTRDPAAPAAHGRWLLQTNSRSFRSLPQIARLGLQHAQVSHWYGEARSELGYADWEVRAPQALLRHWQLVFVAAAFRLLERVAPYQTAALSIAAAPVPSDVPPSVSPAEVSVGALPSLPPSFPIQAAQVALARMAQVPPSRNRAPPETPSMDLIQRLLVGPLQLSDKAAMLYRRHLHPQHLRRAFSSWRSHPDRLPVASSRGFELADLVRRHGLLPLAAFAILGAANPASALADYKSNLKSRTHSALYEGVQVYRASPRWGFAHVLNIPDWHAAGEVNVVGPMLELFIADQPSIATGIELAFYRQLDRAAANDLAYTVLIEDRTASTVWRSATERWTILWRWEEVDNTYVSIRYEERLGLSGVPSPPSVWTLVDERLAGPPISFAVLAEWLWHARSILHGPDRSRSLL